jgi:hypothetical protein
MDNITIRTLLWMGHITRMEDERIPQNVLQGKLHMLWMGHIIRMEDERIPQTVLHRKLHNTRPVGKPRTRQEDVVQRDMSQILGIIGYR